MHPHLKAVVDKKKVEKKKRWEKSNKQRQSKKDKNKKNKFKENSWGATNAIAICIYFAFANVAFFKSVNLEFIVQIDASAISVKTMDFLIAWLLDTGVLYHITHDRFLFFDFKVIFNTSIGEIEKQLTFFGYGTVRLLCRTSTNGRSLKIHNVLYVLDCQFNLLFFAQLQQSGCSLTVTPEGFSIDNNDIHAVRQQGLYALQLDKFVICLFINSDTLQMWHERLDHVNKVSTIAMTQKAGIDLFKPSSTDPCIPCGKVAGKTKPHKSHIQSGRWIENLIHGDLMRPFSVGCNKARWTVCWLDNKTQISHVDTFYSKEVLDVLLSFKTFLDIIQHDFNRCTRIRIDNGFEFMRNVFATFRNEQSIRTELITADNFQMNGCAKRFNQTLMRKISTFHKDSKLSLKWWFELIHAANHIRNALISTSVTNSKGQPISSFEAFTGYSYPIENFRRIEQASEYLVIKPNTGWKKFQDRREPDILVGYEGIKIYRMITTKGAIYRFFNVEWKSNKRPRDSNTTYLNDSIVIESNEGSIITGPTTRSKIAAKNSASTQVNNEINKILDEITVELDEEVRHIATSRQASLKSALQNIAIGNSQQRTSTHSIISAPSINEFSNNVNELGINISSSDNTAGVNTSILNTVSFHTIKHIQQKVLKQDFHLRSRRDSFVDLLALFAKCSFPNFHEPKNYNEAMIDINHKEDWKLVINDEMQSLKDNKIWKLVNSISKNRKVLIGKWIYRAKREINEKIVKYKTRWCVRDFEQVKGLDYYEIFLVVVKFMSYKVIFAIAAANNWDIEQMNVKTAFLYEDIDEEIYVKVPHSYIDNRKIYCRFRKALYDFKQSSRIWFNTFVTYLNKQNFLALNVDQSVFSNNKVIIVIYVNNLLIVDSDSKFIQKTKKTLHKRFQITDLGSLAYYLGMGVQRDRQQRAFYFSQKTYLEKVIRDYDMWECNPMVIFMEFNIKLTAVEADYVCFANEKHRY